MMETDGLVPNAHVYNALLHGYATVGDVAKAIKVLELMDTKGIEKNIVTITSWLDSMCNRGKEWVCRPEYKTRVIAPAEAIFQKEIVEKGMTPSVQTLNILVNIYANSGSSFNVLKIINEMMPQYGLTPNRFTYFSLLNMRLRFNKDMKVVWALIREMRSKGFELDGTAIVQIAHVSHAMAPEWQDKAKRLLTRIDVDVGTFTGGSGGVEVATSRNQQIADEKDRVFGEGWRKAGMFDGQRLWERHVKVCIGCRHAYASTKMQRKIRQSPESFF